MKKSMLHIVISRILYVIPSILHNTDNTVMLMISQIMVYLKPRGCLFINPKRIVALINTDYRIRAVIITLEYSSGFNSEL